MYTLTFGPYTIYDPRVEGLTIRDPAVHLAIGEPGDLSFTIDPDHPSAGQITRLKGVLELQEDGVPIYRGRIISDKKDFDLARAITTEGLLACLNDSIIGPFAFPDDFLEDTAYQTAAASGNVAAFFLGWLLGQHNAQVTAEQQIKLGTVTVADPNNYIARASSEHSSAWETIKGKLAGTSLGGYLLPRYEIDGTYLDYYADLPLTNAQPVEFSENLLDLVNEINAAETYTAILPIGKDGLTLSALPDGAIDSDLTKAGPLIYSASRRTAYGNITRVEKWDDVTEAENLRSKAAAALAASGLAQTITVKAADLHSEGEQSFRVGRYTRLTSAPHNFSELYPLTALDIDIMDPGNTEITLGRTATTQTDRNQTLTDKAGERDDQQQLELDRHERDISDVVRSTTEQITAAIQTSQAIIFQALENYTETGDLETYKQQVSTQFEQTASQIQMTFSTVTEQIQSVNGDLQTKYNERVKYIRFIDGDILLGEDGNQITLKIENDRMTFRQNGLDVAYFSNNKFYITDAEFTVSAKIGSFAFVPGAGGNLSFRKVGA